MAKVKEHSTLQQNKQSSELVCPITYAMNKIGGHWKAIILYYLMNGPKRYHELKKFVPGITEKMLAQHLKELQEDSLVAKETQQLKPLVTLYSLSPLGEELGPVLLGMAEWAIKANSQYQRLIRIEHKDVNS